MATAWPYWLAFFVIGFLALAAAKRLDDREIESWRKPSKEPPPKAPPPSESEPPAAGGSELDGTAGP